MTALLSTIGVREAADGTYEPDQRAASRQHRADDARMTIDQEPPIDSGPPAQGATPVPKTPAPASPQQAAHPASVAASSPSDAAPGTPSLDEWFAAIDGAGDMDELNGIAADFLAGSPFPPDRAAFDKRFGSRRLALTGRGR